MKETHCVKSWHGFGKHLILSTVSLPDGSFPGPEMGNEISKQSPDWMYQDTVLAQLLFHLRGAMYLLMAVESMSRLDHFYEEAPRT